jgi:RHH-type rel operon transcriptional repressor/antitoxin RelB
MTISIRLPNDVESRLQNLVNITGRSKIFYITQAILEHIEVLETLYLTENELAAIQSGVPTAAQLSGLMKRYDSDD